MKAIFPLAALLLLPLPSWAADPLPQLQANTSVLIKQKTAEGACPEGWVAVKVLGFSERDKLVLVHVQGNRDDTVLPLDSICDVQGWVATPPAAPPTP